MKTPKVKYCTHLKLFYFGPQWYLLTRRGPWNFFEQKTLRTPALDGRTNEENAVDFQPYRIVCIHCMFAINWSVIRRQEFTTYLGLLKIATRNLPLNQSPNLQPRLLYVQKTNLKTTSYSSLYLFNKTLYLESICFDLRRFVAVSSSFCFGQANELMPKVY